MKVKLTNLELNTLIAEIEGVLPSMLELVRDRNRQLVHVQEKLTLSSVYDTIENKSLSFDLMIKHGVMAESVNGKIARFVLPFKDKEGKSYYTRFEDEIPQRAIAACIIYKEVKMNE